MPILYVHGVAVRDRGEPGWDAVQPFLRGVDWGHVQGHLRRHVAPVLNPSAPERVMVAEAFWGDLGGVPVQPQDAAQAADAVALPPARLSTAALADALEARGRDLLPVRLWPQMIGAVHAVLQDAALRPQWAEQPGEQAQWDALSRLVGSELRRRYPLEAWPLLAFLRRDMQRHVLQRVGRLRGPLESFLPYFMGDVLGYPLGRGTPEQPGPIPVRVLDALERAYAVKRRTGEPLVVLTHSMGGQLMYDALSAFAPARPGLQGLEVDFWAAAAGQLSLFASLGLFAAPTPPGGVMPPLQGVGYLWNVWNPADLLSFQAAPAIPGAQDVRVPLTDDPLTAHMAYITYPLFYELFAAKLSTRLS